jgi:multisubunit Na+/H+ antiporter MnhB subunit
VRSVVLAIAILAAIAAAVPIVGYVVAEGSRVDPYKNRVARWVVYIAAGLALALFIVLSRSPD